MIIFFILLGLRRLVGEHLVQCGLLKYLQDFNNFDSDCNKYARNHELLKGVLLSGLGNILTVRKWDLQKGILKKQSVVMTESVVLIILLFYNF